MTNFFFLGSKITGWWLQPEIRRQLLLGRKAMTNLDSVLKSKDIILPTKVCIVKDMVFPVLMYWCESWTLKKAERGRFDALELWCWRRLLRVPWMARRSNQSILKEISPEYPLEGLMLKLQYFGYLMWSTDSLGKTWCFKRLRARGEGDDRGWDGWMSSATWLTWVWASSGCFWRTGNPGMLQSMGLQKFNTTERTEVNWSSWRKGIHLHSS